MAFYPHGSLEVSHKVLQISKSLGYTFDEKAFGPFRILNEPFFIAMTSTQLLVQICAVRPNVAVILLPTTQDQEHVTAQLGLGANQVLQLVHL
jgi:hypothetical protein